MGAQINISPAFEHHRWHLSTVNSDSSELHDHPLNQSVCQSRNEYAIDHMVSTGYGLVHEASVGERVVWMADTGPIIEFIEKAGLVDGQRLPAERELAVALQLSRGTVRRMLEKLETEGRIWRHVGRGTFLGRPELASSGEQLQGDVTSEIHPAEVLEARLILEPPVAALAAHRATSAQLESMQRVVSGGAAATSFETFEKLDAAFHEAVVKAAQNKLISYLYATIAKSRDQVVWGQMKRASVTAQRRRRYQSSHEAISLAILDRDAKLAEREMRAHLLEVRANMLGT